MVRPGGRIALLDVGVPRNQLIRWGNSFYFGKVVPKIGALLSDGAAYRYLPKSVAYLPPPERMLADLRARRLRRRRTSPALRRHHPAAARHPELTSVRAISRPLDRDVDLNDIARGDGYLFVRDGVGVAGRGVAARVPDRRCRRRSSRRSSTTIERAGTAHGASVSCRSSPARPASWSSRRWRSVKAADGRAG